MTSSCSAMDPEIGATRVKLKLENYWISFYVTLLRLHHANPSGANFEMAIVVSISISSQHSESDFLSSGMNVNSVLVDVLKYLLRSSRGAVELIVVFIEDNQKGHS